jgi:hypothetical protein
MNFSIENRLGAVRFAVLSCACLVFAITTAGAQTARISLPGRTVTFSELFGAIERQTGSTIIFNADKTVLDKRVTLPSSEGSLTELLDAALPAAGYTYRVADRYILLRAAEPEPQAAAAPQPTREEFERDVRDYTRRNIAGAEEGRVVVRYDTIRTEKPHDGVFRYPSREVTPEATGRTARTPFMRDTPPLLAVKTNLVWLAAGGTLNVSGEAGLGKRTSLELSGGINRWNLKGSAENNKKLGHWVVKPEFRYWLCERFSTGHFFGVHGFYGEYNVGGWDIPLLFEKEFRYEGTAYGGGITYGYNLALSKRWGLEFTVGAGVMRTSYEKYDCEKCGSEVGKFDRTYFGPTELGVKMVFMIK